MKYILPWDFCLPSLKSKCHFWDLPSPTHECAPTVHLTSRTTSTSLPLKSVIQEEGKPENSPLPSVSPELSKSLRMRKITWWFNRFAYVLQCSVQVHSTGLFSHELCHMAHKFITGVYHNRFKKMPWLHWHLFCVSLGYQHTEVLAHWHTGTYPFILIVRTK